MTLNQIIHNRYQINREINSTNNRNLRKDIEIKQFIAQDLKAGGYVLGKKIIIQTELTSDLFREMWSREINISRKVTSLDDGDYLLTFIDAFKEEDSPNLWIIYQYSGESIYELLKNGEKSSYLFYMVSPENRKIMWEKVMNLAKAIKLLHDNLILHRNICFKTVYFQDDGIDAFDLKLGDFSFTLYLYGIDAIINSEKNQIKPKLESIFNPPKNIDGFQSDIYSLGIIILCLRLGIRIEYIENDKIQIEEKREYILEEFKKCKTLLDFEINFLEKICFEFENNYNYTNINEVINDIEGIIRKCLYFDTETKFLPFNTRLVENNPIIIELSRNFNWSIQDILLNPNKFFSRYFVDIDLHISNDPNRPFLFVLQNLRFSLTKSNIQRIAKLVLINQHDRIRRLSKDIEPIHLEYLEYIEIFESKNQKWNYLNWTPHWLYARDKIKKNNQVRYSELEFEKNRYLEIMNVILSSEIQREINKNFFPYRLIEILEVSKYEKRAKIVITEIKLFSELKTKIENSFYKKIQIFESPKINFAPIDNEWKFNEFINTEEGIILNISTSRINREIYDEGFIVFPEFIATKKLIQRKEETISLLNNKKYLLQSLISPSLYNKYIQISDSDDSLIRQIQNTQPLFILQGPPGTGKTFYATKLIIDEINNKPFSKCLITCKEHKALNDLMKKVIQSKTFFNKQPLITRLTSKEAEFELLKDDILKDYLDSTIARSLYNDFINWIKNNKTNYPKLQQFIPSSDIDSFKPLITKEWIDLVKKSSNIIFTTNMSYAVKYLRDNDLNFDLVIEEEAGKCYPSELLAPLVIGQKWVLIGDQNQLPPYEIISIKELIENDFEQYIGRFKSIYEVSDLDINKLKKETIETIKIFEKLFELLKGTKSFSEKSPISILKSQYRLPSTISNLIADVFYDNLEKFDQKSEDPEPDYILQPKDFYNYQLIWLDIPNSPKYFEDRYSHFSNSLEAKIISKLLDKMQLKYPDETKISILTPYKDQLEILNEYLPITAKGQNYVKEIHTVDSFQGKQSDIIIISMVRNNMITSRLKSYGFLVSSERLNVMLSRVKKVMIIVGSFDFFNSYDDKTSELSKTCNFIKKYGIKIPFKKIIEDL